MLLLSIARIRLLQIVWRNKDCGLFTRCLVTTLVVVETEYR